MPDPEGAASNQIGSRKRSPLKVNKTLARSNGERITFEPIAWIPPCESAGMLHFNCLAGHRKFAFRNKVSRYRLVRIAQELPS